MLKRWVNIMKLDSDKKEVICCLCDRTQEVIKSQPLAWLGGISLIAHLVEREVVDSSPLEILSCNNCYDYLVLATNW